MADVANKTPSRIHDVDLALFKATIERRVKTERLAQAFAERTGLAPDAFPRQVRERLSRRDAKMYRTWYKATINEVCADQLLDRNSRPAQPASTSLVSKERVKILGALEFKRLVGRNCSPAKNANNASRDLVCNASAALAAGIFLVNFAEAAPIESSAFFNFLGAAATGGCYFLGGIVSGSMVDDMQSRPIVRMIRALSRQNRASVEDRLMERLGVDKESVAQEVVACQEKAVKTLKPGP